MASITDRDDDEDEGLYPQLQGAVGQMAQGGSAAAPVRGVDPRIIAYFDNLAKTTQNRMSPEYQQSLNASRMQDYAGQLQNSQLAAYAKAGAQIGTLRGKTADTSAVSQFANAANADQNRLDMQTRQDQGELDKTAGINARVYDHLMTQQRINDHMSDVAQGRQDSLAVRKTHYDNQDATAAARVAGKAPPRVRGLGVAPAAAAPDDDDDTTDTDTAEDRPIKGDDRIARDFANQMNASLGRSGELGKLQARVNAGKRVLALGQNDDGTPRNLTRGEMTELASSVASMIASGSVAAQHTVDAMTPQTMWGDVKAQLSYMENDVKESDMPGFVQRLVDTAKREIRVSSDTKREAQAQIVGSSVVHGWRQRNPNAWRHTVRAGGFDPDKDFDDDSHYTPQAAPSAPPPAPKVGGPGMAVAAPATPPSPPKVGDIDGDHRFLGGDPADPKSWQLLGAPMRGAQ